MSAEAAEPGDLWALVRELVEKAKEELRTERERQEQVPERVRAET